MDDKLHFAADLYQGTAEYYDRYRLPYPEAMIEDLIARTGVSGQGRLLDLACGTGQLAFPLRRSFAEIWAVDREPDFARLVQAKAGKLGAGNIRPVISDAETLDAEPGHFELAGFLAIIVSWARLGYRDRASCCWRCASRPALTWPRSCLRTAASLPARSWPRAGTARSACSRPARTSSATPLAGCANW